MLGDDESQADPVEDLLGCVSEDSRKFGIDSLNVVPVIHQHDGFGTLVEEFVEVNPLTFFRKFSCGCKPGGTAGTQEKREKVWDSFRIHHEGISGMNEVVVNRQRTKCHAKQTRPRASKPSSRHNRRKEEDDERIGDVGLQQKRQQQSDGGQARSHSIAPYDVPRTRRFIADSLLLRCVAQA